MTERDLTRRDFVMMGAAGTAALFLNQKLPLGGKSPMPERPLGRTGHQVRLFSLGGQATLEQADRDADAEAIINRAIDLGVNYIDTAARYGRGVSQKYIGKVMSTRRNEVFLATKTHDRTREGSLRLLEESLQSLQTDHLDLWQLHNVRRTDELDTIFGQGGAIEAMIQAREEGIVRFLGITGHADPAVLADGISRFDFDTILMALNAADPHHLPFVDELLPLANQKQMGVIGMKIPARGRIFREGGITSMRDAMRYTLTQPVSTVIVGVDDIAQLEENVAIAAEFEPLSRDRMAHLEELTTDYVSEASWFKRGARGSSGDEDDQDID
jgi:aryl-alcohol dehydrogenase-like predicted oxidoreductase